MGILRCERTGRRCSLGFRNIVGRSTLAHIRVPGSTVSAEHASIYFSGSSWKLRDLGSRNGTRLNETPLESDGSVALEPGCLLIFGSSDATKWVLEDASPPGPSARPHGSKSQHGRLTGVEGTLWIPDESEPEACILFDGSRWVLDSKAQRREVSDGDEVQLARKIWVLELPSWDAEDAAATMVSTVGVQERDQYRLDFEVSLDEEHVSLRVGWAGQVFDLGARAHNHTLLFLARRHASDLKQGVPDQEAGWVYADELKRTLSLDRVAANLQLWRATQVLKKKGLPAQGLIERRLDSGQLRIGIGGRIGEVTTTGSGLS